MKKAGVAAGASKPKAKKTKVKKMAMTFDELLQQATTDVETFGWVVLKLSRNRAYQAAKSKVFPVIETEGFRMRVPVRRALEHLGILRASQS